MRPTQPPLVSAPAGELTAVVATLSLGGAERIVIDWAARVHPARRVHVVVLRDAAHEWLVPSSIHITRLGGVDVIPRLQAIGRSVAASPTPVCVCHLLTRTERDALASGGAFVVPVVHNAYEGWIEDAAALAGMPHVIAVSAAAANDLKRHGCTSTVSVIRHIPKPRRFACDARAEWRRAWRIPQEATVAGMIGSVKPQKNYPFAVRLLRRLLEERNIYLAIIGGPAGRNGRDEWHAVLEVVREAGVRGRLAMPGFIEDASGALPAFDLLLNTSHYEGTSIATLEALVSGVPVVASRVGGQGELASEGLTLVDTDAPLSTWAHAVLSAIERRPSSPLWTGFPSSRLWTLAHLARPFERSDRVLFVTANLNAGGAQRSLVNLTTSLRDTALDIVVTGDTTASYFYERLRATGIRVHRTAASRDAFDHAERIVECVCAERIGTLCFWNVDPKIKLLVAKALGFTDVALVDVSPGPNSFEEMRRVTEFGRLIAFTEPDFYARLDRLVVKYRAAVPVASARRISVISNGVSSPARVKAVYAIAGAPRIVVNGRIAPTKFIVEIVQAMQIVRRAVPLAELHIFGAAEPRHRDYEISVRNAARSHIDRAVFFHGGSGDSAERLADYDLFVVLGREQGSPNALLEALAAGLPCIANDDGGTAEQVIDGETGLLVPDGSPQTLATAIVRLLGDRALAERIGRGGRDHVLRSFSMDAMVARYEELFASLSSKRAGKEMTA